MLSVIRIMFFVASILWTHCVYSGEFVEYLDSVPMMKGFNVNLEEAVLLDKPEGRVASVSAYGKDKVDAVMAYYQERLPEFGWELVKPYLFLKKGEYLMIEPSRAGDFTVIVFFNFPKID